MSQALPGISDIKLIRTDTTLDLVLKYISDSLMRTRQCDVSLNYVQQILLHGGTNVGTQIAWEA